MPAASPSPWSVTRSTTPSPSARTLTSMRLPAGVNFTAGQGHHNVIQTADAALDRGRARHR